MRDEGSIPLRVYRRLRRRYGPAGWWPGRTAFEVCLGAILTQNTSWTNVERTLTGLRRRGLLSYLRLQSKSAGDLAPLLRSSGTFNVKAQRVAAFLAFLKREYGGRLSAMKSEAPGDLRRKLLAVHGIGRETADSIALYAAGMRLFVVDAYTRRIFSRLGWIRGTENYDEVQRFVMDRLPRSVPLYNDYHAQVVKLGKEVCRPAPRCHACPLEDLCPKRGVAGRRRSS